MEIVLLYVSFFGLAKHPPGFHRKYIIQAKGIGVAFSLPTRLSKVIIAYALSGIYGDS